MSHHHIIMMQPQFVNLINKEKKEVISLHPLMISSKIFRAIAKRLYLSIKVMIILLITITANLYYKKKLLVILSLSKSMSQILRNQLYYCVKWKKNYQKSLKRRSKRGMNIIKSRHWLISNNKSNFNLEIFIFKVNNSNNKSLNLLPRKLRKSRKIYKRIYTRLSNYC